MALKYFLARIVKKSGEDSQVRAYDIIVNKSNINDIPDLNPAQKQVISSLDLEINKLYYFYKAELDIHSKTMKAQFATLLPEPKQFKAVDKKDHSTTEEICTTDLFAKQTVSIPSETSLKILDFNTAASKLWAKDSY